MQYVKPSQLLRQYSHPFRVAFTSTVAASAMGSGRRDTSAFRPLKKRYDSDQAARRSEHQDTCSVRAAHLSLCPVRSLHSARQPQPAPCSCRPVSVLTLQAQSDAYPAPPKIAAKTGSWMR